LPLHSQNSVASEFGKKNVKQKPRDRRVLLCQAFLSDGNITMGFSSCTGHHTESYEFGILRCEMVRQLFSLNCKTQ
jgi:hypothetical protein